MTKTVFILITSGFTSRNVLYTDIFSVLKLSPHRFVFLIPPGTKSDYTNLAQVGKVIFEEYKLPSLLERKFSNFRLLNSFSQGTTFKLKTKTIQDKRTVFKKKGLLRYYSLRFFTWIVSFDRIFLFLRWLDWRLFKKEWLKVLFVKYDPALIYSTDPYFFDEVYFLEFAKQRRTKIISQVLSWDNVTNRGYLAVVPDQLIVWNNIMKTKIMEIYNINSERIFVAGVPHFDRYFKSAISSKEVFFTDLGLDLNKKLITFFTSSPANFPMEHLAVKNIFNLLLLDTEFFKKHQILLRLNPKDTIDRYEGIKDLPGVILNNISVVDSRFRDNWNPKEKEIMELAATLKYSDLVVGMSSTICIESAIFNTPEVVLDMDKNSHYFYEMDHFQPIIESGGVYMAYNAEGAVAGMQRYLADPGLDQVGREKIVRDLCVFTDGKSGQRVADFILNNI